MGVVKCIKAIGGKGGIKTWHDRIEDDTVTYHKKIFFV